MLKADLTQFPSRRNARLIIAARLLSDFGAFLNMVALSSYVYGISGSVFSLSVFLACRVAGGLCASLIGTAFYRRWQGRFPLASLDLLRAGLLVPLLILPGHLQGQLFPFLAFGIGLSNSLFAIGLNSQMPSLVDAGRLPRTNAWLASMAATGAVMGSLLSGVLVAVYGYATVFMVNIITYLLAAMLIVPLQFQRLASISTGNKGNRRALRQRLRETPALVAMLILTLADTLGSAAHNVGFPILAKLLTPDETSRTLGLILAGWALGKFLGARLGSRLTCDNNPVLERRFFLGVLLMSSAFIWMFQQEQLLWVLLFAIPAGVGDGLSEVALLSRLQREPETVRLPLFSMLTFMQMSGFGLGMLLAAPFYAWWSPGLVVLLFHGAVLSTLIVAYFWLEQKRD